MNKKFWAVCQIFLLLLLVACKENEQPSEIKQLIDTIKVSRDSTHSEYVSQTEPVVVDTPTVVFFMPGYKERAEIIHFYGEYSRYDFEYIFSNFQKLASRAKYPLRKEGINSFLTYNWKFHIKTDSGYVDFDRKEQDEILGIILADGKKAPVIKYGLYKNNEFSQMVRDYFGKKDFILRGEFFGPSTRVQQDDVGNP